MSLSRAFQWVGVAAVLLVLVGLNYEFESKAGMQMNTAPESPLSQSLRGYWKLDDGSGTNATDSSGNANTLAMTGSPSWTTGNIGPYALDFSGTGQYLSVADPASGVLDIGDSMDFSITGWFNRDTAAADHTIVAKKNNQTTSAGYVVWIDNNGSTDYLSAEISDGTDTYSAIGTTDLSTTGWHHFSVIWDDSKGLYIYLDGKLDGSTTSSTSSINSLANALAFRIGAESDAGVPFDGKLDDIRVYGYALSADQVKKVYNTTSPTQPIDTSLVGHWTFDGPDIQGTTAIDRSSFGNNGTMTGTTKTIGKLGQALSFNGSSDVIYVPSSSSLDQQPKFTFCAWVYATGWGGNSEGIIAFKGYFPGGGKTYLLLENFSGESSFFGAVSAPTPADSRASNGSFSLNVWTFLCSTYDNTDDRKMHLYKNGTEVSYSFQQAAIGTATSEANEYLFIGAETYSPSYSFQGKIDDVRIYNRALSATEVTSLYNLGK